MKIRNVVVFVLTNLFAMGEQFEKTVIYAAIGDTTTLKCPLRSQNLSAQWVHLHTNSVIFDGFNINPKLMNNETSSPKFEITGSSEREEYNLKINDVENQNKGDYKCDTEINGIPISKFFSLVIRENPQINSSDENITESNNPKPEGFSIFQWIMIFTSAVVSIFILTLVVAGVLKVKRSNHGQNETDTERAPEFLYETINDTGVIRAPSSGSPRSNITNLRPSEHTFESERSVTVTLCSDSNSVPSRSYATQLSVHIPDIFFDNKTDSETSSTQSLDKTLGLVYEPQYINDFHP